MALYESRTELRCSPQRAFEFLIRPANMQSVAPPELGMVFVNPPEVIALGSKLIFKVQAHGFVQQIEHEVTRFEPIAGFSEKMIKGPLGSWIHDYLLEPAEHGVTLVNKIAFAPPGGMLGMILTEQRLRDQLEEGYHHRSAALKKGARRMTADAESIIARLATVIAERDRDRPAGSYTVELLAGGHPVLAGKLIEEAYELVSAGAEAADDPSAVQAVAHEAADVIFHLLVFLQAQGVEWRMVERELTGRFGVSGLAEKAARTQEPR